MTYYVVQMYRNNPNNTNENLIFYLFHFVKQTALNLFLTSRIVLDAAYILFLTKDMKLLLIAN